MSKPTPGMVEHWAEIRPDDTAIVEGERTLTWMQLNAAADRLAGAFAAHGVGSGAIVVVRTHIRLEWAIIAAALAKLGCYMLGLNWRLTPEECRYVLSNSGATILICDDPEPAALMAALEGLAIRLAVSIDAAAPGFEDFAVLLRHESPARFAGAEPPLVVYTSGTTGLPKGVVTGGRDGDPAKVREYRESVAASRSGKDGDVALVCMPMHHASGPAQMWSSMRRGNKTVLLRRFSPEGVLELIEQHRVNTIGTVPTMLKRLAALPVETLSRYDVSSLRKLTVGAAPVPHQIKLWAMDYFGDCIQEGYGATEVSMVSVLEPEMQRTKPGSSGRPYRHVDIEVRDASGNRLAPGQTGEIWVRTPVTIQRYLNAAQLDEDTLDADGFFRVGDIGHVDEDGYLFITDRAKDMIISGGVNIYPAEIEVALLSHPAVQDAAVIGIPHEEFGEQVLAFCELKPGAKASADEILGHCKTRLASYKQPRRIEFMDELPRNTMGKILKKDLRMPYWKGRERRV